MRVTRLLNGARVIASDCVAIGRRELDFHKARPWNSILMLTCRCNSRCRNCTMWQRPQAEERRREIGLEQWKLIVDRLADAGIRNAEVFGGNVLLRKALLLELLQHLHRRGFTVHLATNQLGIDDRVAEAFAAHVDALYISVDGLGAQQDTLRGVSGASECTDTAVARVLAARNRVHSDKRLRIICNTTVSRYNYQQVEPLIRFAESRGFDEIHFEYVGEFQPRDIASSGIDGVWPDPYFVRRDESAYLRPFEATLFKQLLREIKADRRRYAIDITTINIDSLSTQNLWQGTIPHRKCYLERNEVTVDPTGAVVGCPFFNNYALGNLLEAPLDKIWKAPRHRHFRWLQNRGDLTICRHCILGVQRNPGPLKSLARVYHTRIAQTLLTG